MKVVFSLCIIYMSIFGGPGNLWAILKKADKTCVTYDFENKREIHGERLFGHPDAIRRIAGELEKAGFDYNKDCDTLVVCLEYIDYLVFPHKSVHGKTTYYSLPSEIHAYSSKCESHLVLNESYAYIDEVIRSKGPYSQTDPLPKVIRRSDEGLFKDIYAKYGDFALGGYGKHVRITLKNGRIDSVTNWNYTMNMFFWNDEKALSSCEVDGLL